MSLLWMAMYFSLHKRKHTNGQLFKMEIIYKPNSRCLLSTTSKDKDEPR
jgi:hypothetical protein